MLTQRQVGTVKTAKKNHFLVQGNQLLIPQPRLPHASCSGQDGLDAIDEEEELGLSVEPSGRPQLADRPDGDGQVEEELQQGKEREE